MSPMTAGSHASSGRRAATTSCACSNLTAAFGPGPGRGGRGGAVPRGGAGLIRSRLLCCPAGDLDAGVDAEAVEDFGHVRLDGALGQEQAGADLLVAEALGDEPGDLETLDEGTQLEVLR